LQRRARDSAPSSVTGTHEQARCVQCLFARAAPTCVRVAQGGDFGVSLALGKVELLHLVAKVLSELLEACFDMLEGSVARVAPAGVLGLWRERLAWGGALAVPYADLVSKGYQLPHKRVLKR
jgi:hypothetical protein